MELTFITADVPLAKTFVQTEHGIENYPYPMVRNVSSETFEIEDLQAFKDILAIQAKQGASLFRGSLTKKLKQESRAGLCDKHRKTDWFMLDIDHGDFANHEEVIASLPTCFQAASYIVHYSSSYGITKHHFAGHFYFLLDEPMQPETLKLYTKHLNVEHFRAAIRLNSINTVPLWPLDPAVNEASRLIYIADPVVKGFEHEIRERTKLVEKTENFLTIPSDFPNPSNRITRIVNELRDTKGLPKPRPVRNNVLKGIGEAKITGIREQRGFVYFNLNGGDSWGYYHPVEEPDFIFNFKGEPTYKTAELLPRYFAEVKQDTRVRDDKVFLAFRDFNSDTYYNGWYDNTTDRHTLVPVGNKTKIRDFFESRGMENPDVIEDWNMSFDFANDEVINFDERRINLFQRSDFLRAAVDSTATTRIPPTIRKVIWNVVGSSEEEFDYFINWLAGLTQQRKQLKTAWIFSGIQGTGKGVLINNILAPIIGREYVVAKTLAGMEDNFNGYLEQCCLLMLDEFRIADSPIKAKQIMANIKNMIVEPKLSVRHMRQAARMVNNYVNVIVCSNEPDPVFIAASDRRFNVGVYQTNKLELSNEEFERLEAELGSFANYLMNYQVDTEKLRTPLQNINKEHLQQITGSASELVASNLMAGNFDFLLGMLPDSSKPKTMEAAAYHQALTYIYNTGPEIVQLSRDQLFDIFNYTVGNMPSTPTKFTQFLRHRNIFIKPMRIDNRTVRGVCIDFIIDKNAADELFDDKDQKLKVIKCNIR